MSSWVTKQNATCKMDDLLRETMERKSVGELCGEDTMAESVSRAAAHVLLVSKHKDACSFVVRNDKRVRYSQV